MLELRGINEVIYMPRGIHTTVAPGATCRVIGGGRLRDDPRYSLFHNAKHRAKKKGIPFTISMDDIIIPTLCPLLEIPILLDTGDKHSPNNPSLDRIKCDPAIGYVSGNIQVISSRANWLKADASIEELELLVFGMHCPA